MPDAGHFPPQQQQRCPHYRGVPAGEQAIPSQQQGLDGQMPGPCQWQRPQEQQHYPGQHAHMEAGDAQNVGNAQIVEGGAVILGDEIPGAQEHRSGVCTGVLAHDGHQASRQVMSACRKETRQRELARTRTQLRAAVKAVRHAALEQVFLEIKAAGVDLALRVVHLGGQLHLRAGDEPFRRQLVLLQVEGPVGAAGRGAVQGDVDQHGLYLAVLPQVELLSDCAMHEEISLLGQCGVIRLVSQPAAERCKANA